MSDYYLERFWEDVKDPSWPPVSTWNDFLKVDDEIQKSCFDQHGLQQRLDEIENPRYWLPISLHGNGLMKKDRFVFINVLKCGSRHYEDFFLNRLGWERIFPDSMEELDGYIKFGLMMHPLDRYLKGLTEFAWNLDIKDNHLQKFVTESLMPDVHSLSYNLTYGSLLDKIHWIPFQKMLDKDVKACMNNLFDFYGSKIRIPTEHPARHESSLEKRLLHEKISLHWHRQSAFKTSLPLIYCAYARDLKFYRLLITHFKPDWAHLKAN